MTQGDSFASVEKRLRRGEDAAEREVFHRFARPLIALARRQFERRLAHRIDPEDVVQSAFKSFFIRHREGKLQVCGWDNVWGLLTLIALRKCADRVGYHRAGRRDVRREIAAGPEGPDQHWEQAPGREPTPEEAAVLAETIESLFRSLDAADRPVLELSLRGHSAAEIGLLLGRAVRTVHRIRERIHNGLRRRAEG